MHCGLLEAGHDHAREKVEGSSALRIWGSSMDAGRLQEGVESEPSRTSEVWVVGTGGGRHFGQGRSKNGSVWLERRMPGWGRENDLGNVQL